MQEQRLMNHYTKILELNKMNSKSFFDLYKKIEPFFEKIDLKDSNIILAVSGWADSMLMSCVIFQYFKNKSLPLNHIHIAHCNHKIRLESENEAKFMSDFFSGLDFHLFERIEKWLAEDESSLRIRRYSQLSSLQKSSKSSYIFLGHHLNDRVESSILHMMRWANIKWFLNMRQTQSHPLLPKDCKACRPLLNISKSEILNVCKEIRLPYFEDKTNQDCSISKRNRIRHNIVEPLSTYWVENWKENCFLQSFVSMYENVEEYESLTENEFNENSLCTIPSHPLRNTEFSYKFNAPINGLEENTLLSLFEALWLRSFISSTMVSERLKWLNSAKNGNKFFHWVNFLIHEGELYIIKAERNFWERKNNSEEDVEIYIESMDNIRFFWFDLNIPREELVWWIVRLPNPWDNFAWKSRHRRALNQKIPMWRRDRIPLAIKNRKVIHMWKNIWNNFNCK